MTANPLLKESTLDFHYPPFDQIKDEHFAPAYEQGMAEQLKEIEPIASNPEAPTFENTIVALEKTGVLLERVDRIFSNLASANTNPTLQKVETEMAPKLAAQRDAIYLNGPLFKRVETLYNERAKLGLDEESQWLIERYYKDFVRAGAQLSDADKTRLKRMNSELAGLQTRFSQNVLKEKNAEAIVVDKEETAGRFFSVRTGGGARSRERGEEGRQICHSPPEHDTAAGPDRSEKPRAARTDHENVARAQQSRQRVGQPQGGAPAGEIARRTRRASRLRQPCRLSTRRPDGARRRHGEQIARATRAARGRERAQGSGR